jgi:hypothetical protein
MGSNLLCWRFFSFGAYENCFFASSIMSLFLSQPIPLIYFFSYKMVCKTVIIH